MGARAPTRLPRAHAPPAQQAAKEDFTDLLEEQEKRRKRKLEGSAGAEPKGKKATLKF